jgi:AraC-like DNA-binding protein
MAFQRENMTITRHALHRSKWVAHRNLQPRRAVVFSRKINVLAVIRCCVLISAVPQETSSASLAPSFLSTQITASSRFHLDLKPNPSARLSVVCGGWEQCSPDYIINRPTFAYHSVELVVSGNGTANLGGKDYPLSSGTVFTYGPRKPHGIRTAPDAPLLKYFVDFSGRDCRRLMSDCGLGGDAPIQLSSVGDVRAKFEELILLGLNRDQRTDRTCALQLELLLHTMARSSRPATAAAQHLQATFKRCRQYMDQNFLTISSVEEVAAACHLHKSHLSRVFRQFHNESPLRYLQRLQMQWAADRLHRSGALVREVADELGIDPFQFSRTFKRVHGRSPRMLLRSQP